MQNADSFKVIVLNRRASHVMRADLQPATNMYIIFLRWSKNCFLGSGKTQHDNCQVFADIRHMVGLVC